MSYKSNYILPEPGLILLPSLAAKIGVNEAIFLQQIHYWITRDAGIIDQYGRHWIYNTIKQWQKQLSFLSESTIRRAIGNLEERGLLLSMWYGEGFDRKKIYTIDYDCMDALSQEIAREQAQESMRQAEEQGRKVIFVTVPLKPKADDELPEDVKDAREEPPEEVLLQDEICEGSIRTIQDEHIGLCKSSNAKNHFDHIATDNQIDRIGLAKMKEGVSQIEQRSSLNLTNPKNHFEHPRKPMATRLSDTPSRARAKTTEITTEITAETTTPCRETSKSQDPSDSSLTEEQLVVADDLLAFCTALNIPEAVTVQCVQEYGESAVWEKAKMLQLADQRKLIRNAAGWLVTALKRAYVHTPVRTSETEQAKYQKARQEARQEEAERRKQALEAHMERARQRALKREEAQENTAPPPPALRELLGRLRNGCPQT